MTDDCIERFNMDFLWCVWNFAHNQKEFILSKLEIYKYGKQIIILKNTQQLEDFLSELN
jgi:hypothetical protein